ncbi:hypothetical protein IJG20_01840 [Candidatus Saccharibacteria bacterium]|nr:hypothetical protein [Candidatus Saccharibacteria bacterium]
MKHFNYKVITTLIFSAFFALFGIRTLAYAEEEEISFQVSPMNQQITLTPGERYYGTFKVTSSVANKYPFIYKTDIRPFTVNDNYDVVYENNGDYNQIVDWITIVNGTGIIQPNNTEIIQFYIDVPENAPAGGQYAIINVSSDNQATADEGINIKAEYAIAHVIYAEVAGETKRSGDITKVSVPSFLFSGTISGTASIKNTGNVHSDASYTLQVFPFFSKEEVFSNEENPKTNTILPEATRTTTVNWPETPKIGIFHVIYSVEYEGVESKVDKYVIVCPIWLLIVLLTCLFVVIFSIIFGKKKEKKGKKN